MANRVVELVREVNGVLWELLFFLLLFGVVVAMMIAIIVATLVFVALIVAAYFANLISFLTRWLLIFGGPSEKAFEVKIRRYDVFLTFDVDSEVRTNEFIQVHLPLLAHPLVRRCLLGRANTMFAFEVGQTLELEAAFHVGA